MIKKNKPKTNPTPRTKPIVELRRAAHPPISRTLCPPLRSSPKLKLSSLLRSLSEPTSRLAASSTQTPNATHTLSSKPISCPLCASSPPVRSRPKLYLSTLLRSLSFSSSRRFHQGGRPWQCRCFPGGRTPPLQAQPPQCQLVM